MKFKQLYFIYIALLAISASFPLLPYGLRSVVTIASPVMALILAGKYAKAIKRPWLTFFYFNLPILILLISLVYSNQVEEGLKDLTQMLSLLAFPLTFVLYSITKKEVTFLKVIFILSLLILILYQALKIGLNYDMMFAQPTTLELKINGIKSISDVDINEIQSIKTRRIREFLQMLTNTHPTYQSIWSVFAIGLLFNIRKYFTKQWQKVVFVVSLMTLIFWIFLIASRMPIVAGAVSAVIIGFKLPFKTKLILTLSVFSLSFLAYLSFPSIQNRIDEVFNFSDNLIQSGSDVRDFDSTNIRLGIYTCVIDLHQSEPIFGYGLGNVQNHLSNCLVTKINPKIYNWRTYNTHNQYFYFLLTSGILGIILFFIWVWKLFQIAFRYEILLFVFLLTFILICFLTENVLSRNDGVLFFGFFSGLLLFNTLNSQK